jgi:ribosomal protein L28
MTRTILCDISYVNGKSISDKSNQRGKRRWKDTAMIKVPKEKRGNKGRLGISTQCILYPDPKSSEEITTFDLGKGGMCIFSNKSLEVGHEVEIRCEAIWDKPKIGTVRWCQKIKHDLYRVGISFS